MTEAERELTRKWVENWKVTGPLLEQIKKEELRAMTEEERVETVVGLLSHAPPAPEGGPRKPDDTSGMVEQQRYFMRLWRDGPRE